MDKKEIKNRISLVDDRTKVLAKKYPFVFTAVVIASGLIGFVIGKIL